MPRCGKGSRACSKSRSGRRSMRLSTASARSIDELWSQAALLGWLGFGIPEQYGGLGIGARGLAILHGELGRQATPGPISRHSRRAGDRGLRGRGRQQAIAPYRSGEISAAVPANSPAADESGGMVPARCGASARRCRLSVARPATRLEPRRARRRRGKRVPIWDRTREISRSGSAREAHRDARRRRAAAIRCCVR